MTISAQYVYKIPPNMSFQDGAALFMNYVTAHMLLFDIGGMRPGCNVLVHSVGGGVVSSPLTLKVAPSLMHYTAV